MRAGLYGGGAWLLATAAVELPLGAFTALLFTAIAYPIAGLRGGGGPFFFFALSRRCCPPFLRR